MKTLLRLIRRGMLYLVAQSNYPTSRERMMGMFTLGKEAGRKEALKTLPITQVQPRQTVQQVVLHLPTGEWSREYRESKLIVPRGPVDQGTKQPVIRTNTDPLDQDDSWLNSKPPIAVKDMKPEQIAEVPTIRDLTKEWDKDKTEERTAIDKLLYQGRQERQARHAG